MSATAGLRRRRGCSRAEHAGRNRGRFLAPILEQGTVPCSSPAPRLLQGEKNMTNENIRNQDLTGTREILVVSFGTSFAQNRGETIGAIEDEAARCFPDWEVRRAFTSGMVIRHIQKSEGIVIDNVREGLERALRCGVRELVIQPTHLMDGKEYDKITEAAAEYARDFEQLQIAGPLLSSEEDFTAVCRAVCEEAGKTLGTMESAGGAAVFMGHGTDAASNRVYALLQERMTALGYHDCFIATVEGTPVLEDVLEVLLEREYHTILLAPLMVVAGDHANNDLAGEGEDSWKSILEKCGFATAPVLKGLGGYPKIREIYMSHIQQAMQEMRSR